MSQNIYMNCVQKVRKTEQTETEVEEVYVNSDIINCHRELKQTDADIAKRNQQTQQKGGDAAGGKSHRLIAVCVLLLLLLCVLLLTGVTVLWIKFNNLNAEKDQLQSRYDNMTIERDQLQTCCNNMTKERGRLQLEIEWLENNCKTMLIRKGQLPLETSCNVVTTERDQLEKEKQELLKGLYQLGWRYFNSSVYYISNESKNWTESRVDCIQRESELVIINTMKEQEFISTSFNTTGAWIGLSYSDKESTWKWVDDTALTTAYWLEGEPTHYGNCAITTYSTGSDMHTWTEYPCNGTVFSICEKMIN